jgi:tRNA A-37 threonylcarbamoyl transferase component Bud32
MSVVSMPLRVGPYELLRKLGSGGMAIVYEARHRGLGKRVALKIHHRNALDEESTPRFLREGRAVARIRHPHVIEIFDSGVEDGVPYLAMPLLDGVDLAQYLREQGPLPLARVIAIVLPVLSAVAAAHAAGVVHRDLKPANVFVVARAGAGLHPIVLDFGISKPVDDGPVDLTHSAEVLGTAHYMAPEQTRGARYADARSDQYSLGAILYECSTGERPFEGESSYELMHAVMTAAIVPPSELEPGLPAAFDRIVARAMNRVAAKRFGSVTELGRALIALADAPTRKAWQAEFEPRDGELPEGVAPTVVATAGDARGTFRDPREAPAAASARRGLPLALAAAAVTVLAGLALTSAFAHAPPPTRAESAAPAAPTVQPSALAAPAVETSPPAAVGAVAAAPPAPTVARPRESVGSRRALLAPAPHPVASSTASVSSVERGQNGSPILQ